MITSNLVEIPNTEHITTEYIESELKKRDFLPLRWALVHSNSEKLTISVSSEK